MHSFTCVYINTKFKKVHRIKRGLRLLGVLEKQVVKATGDLTFKDVCWQD